MTAPFTIPLPTYQCHKRVQALRIKAVVPNPRGKELHFEDERFCPIEVPHGWMAKHLTGDNGTSQLVGGYAVWYEDGYMSWSPAADFEAGYTLVETDAGFKPWVAIHLKTGNEYRVIGEAIDATNAASSRPMVIYERDGRTFVRCAEEFLEKFQPADDGPGEEDGQWAAGWEERCGQVGPATQAAVAADLARYGIDCPGETQAAREVAK